MTIEFLKNKSSRRRDLALDAMASMVMIADANLHIRYLNPSLRSLLRNAEADLRRELPAFAVDKLIGSNIDIFHKAPSHQRNMLAKLTAPHNATIRVGEHVFDLLVAPLRSKGQLSGYVVEWKDARDRLANLEFSAQMSAIGSQAIIEFKPDGTIVTANPNFLRVMGYDLSEVVGKHHSMFVDSRFAASTEYAEFWRRLREGESQSDEFKRVAKGGGVVWVQGSYNPIRNLDGKVSKVVKYVMDVTARRVAVEEIGAALRDLADGKLSRRITVAVPPELESIRHDLNRAAETLGGAIERVGETSHTIAVGLDEINVASADLSQRTEQQAATLEQTVASLSEVMQGVNSTAAEAQTASTAASSAMRCAEQGVVVVTEAIGAINEIEQSSNRIGNIIGVIDEIAFQTNLLALNAGVEAARAGEAGRGFAVVAQEVRGLAQRSAEAAKEIKGLIATSSGQVERGVKLAVASGKSLEEIVAGVAEMKGMAERIAKSAAEQATGLREVTIAADQMDKITQQNAAMVEESTAAAQSLQQETESMANMMARFDVGAPVAAQTKPVAKRRPQPHLPVQRRTSGRAALAVVPADERVVEGWSEF